MKQNKPPGGDSYYYWKIVNMILACVILILAILIIPGGKGGLLTPATFFLGVVMCSLSGIMELARNKKGDWLYLFGLCGNFDSGADNQCDTNMVRE